MKTEHPIISVAGNTGKWSNARIPKIGDRVRVNFNQLGTGKILTTFTEGDFLGVLVMPDPGQRPDWHIAQFKRNGKPFTGYMVFGAEIVFLDPEQA